MASSFSVMKLLMLFTFFSLVRFGVVLAAINNAKHYIVYMGMHSHPDAESVMTANHQTLSSVIGSLDEAREAILHHYSKSFRGFSAMLTEEQAQKLRETDSVISVFESRMNEIHTTHSWEFLGVSSLYQGDILPLNSISDVIVGVIDTGVWPESKSFNDNGLGPIPAKFKGECVTGSNFSLSNCNRKIIGARYYYKGIEAYFGPLQSFNKTFYLSARDGDGHGTHTASTIAGSMVPNVSLYGLGQGTAMGGAPGARLAIYKACWFYMCADSDILAAMDDAISDGVDILSLSLGPSPPQPSYFHNVITIGAFHAFRNGILVSASAGNSFLPRTCVNAAPWILTVAASSIDREFVSNIYLGNSVILKVTQDDMVKHITCSNFPSNFLKEGILGLQGYALNPLKMESSYSLISGSAAAAPGIPAKNASFCKNSTLDPALVKGRIVVCAVDELLEDRRAKAVLIRDAGGVGMILIDSLARAVGFQFVIPGSAITEGEATKLLAYITTDKNPTAKIIPTVTVMNTKPAPQMAIFSSMGPNVVSPDIIKPDITAPGVNVLAAWSPVATTATSGRLVEYNVISGTSMSCPHVSAVSAILKSVHPSWSPAAIKSAIMTTATIMDNTQHLISRDPNVSEATPFDYGAGQINLAAALDPGLIYDHDSNHIINFLCSTGASPEQLKNLTDQELHCPNSPIPSSDFNYPSIGVANMSGNLSVHRTVTYCGKGPTVYYPFINHPDGVRLTVTPSQLEFKQAGEKVSFSIDFSPYKSSNGSFVFGELIWSNGVHRVRSPVGLNVVSL